MTEEVKNEIPQLKTINQFIKEYPCFTQGSMRFYVFNEKNNGLESAGAVVRVGGKVLIDVKRFFNWVEKLNPHRNRSNGNV